MLLISHFKWFLTRLHCSVSDDDSLLIDKLYFTEERFSSKMFHLRLLTKFLPPSLLKRQMLLKISKNFLSMFTYGFNGKRCDFKNLPASEDIMNQL